MRHAKRKTQTAVGFNPFRSGSRTTLDIAMVVGAVVVTLAGVAWAIFGG